MSQGLAENTPLIDEHFLFYGHDSDHVNVFINVMTGLLLKVALFYANTGLLRLGWIHNLSHYIQYEFIINPAIQGLIHTLIRTNVLSADVLYVYMVMYWAWGHSMT